MKLWLQEMFGRCSCTQSGGWGGGGLKGRCLSFCPSHCLLLSICFACISVLHRISISLLIPISFISSLNVAKGFINFLSCMKVRTKNLLLTLTLESASWKLPIICRNDHSMCFLSFRCTGAFILTNVPCKDTELIFESSPHRTSSPSTPPSVVGNMLVYTFVILYCTCQHSLFSTPQSLPSLYPLHSFTQPSNSL